MKSERIEENTNAQNIQNLEAMGGNLTNVASAMQKMTVQQGIMLDKSILPSRGAFYPQEIRVKKLSTIDIKNLSTLTEDNVNQVINNIISRCVIGIEANNILLADKLWFIFYLRSITYNDIPMELTHTCPKCKATTTYEFKFNSLDIKYLPDDFNGSMTLPSGNVLEVVFPTLGMEKQVQYLLNDNNYVQKFDKELLDIACYIKKVNDKVLNLVEAYNFLANMDAMDFSYFANKLSDNNIGVQPLYDYSCPCGTIAKKKITFSSEFFMPKIKI